MHSKDLDFRIIFEQLEKVQRSELPPATTTEDPDFAEIDEIRRLREMIAQMTETPYIYFSGT